MPRISQYGFVYILRSERLSQWGAQTLSRYTGTPLGPYLWKIGKAEDVEIRLATLCRERYAGCGDWTPIEIVELSRPEEVEGYLHRWIEKGATTDGYDRWEWIDPDSYGLFSADGSRSTEVFKAPLPAVINYVRRASRTGFPAATEED